METVITEHVRFEAQRRGIDLEFVLSTVEHRSKKSPQKRIGLFFRVSIMIR